MTDPQKRVAAIRARLKAGAQVHGGFAPDYDAMSDVALLLYLLDAVNAEIGEWATSLADGLRVDAHRAEKWATEVRVLIGDKEPVP